jgi:ribosomal protein S18 acetylase RimI-like enzyme
LKDKKVSEDNQLITLTKARNSHGEEIRRQNSIYFGDVDTGLILPEQDEENGYITYIVEFDCAAIGKIKVERDNKSAFISGFGIVPEYRSKGFGKAALQKTIEMLWKEGILDISLDVACENSKALNLYKSCGFVEESIMNYYEV